MLLAATAICMAVGVAAVAQQPRHAERERRIEQELESIAPAAVPLFQKATRAMDEGDSAAATQLYRQALAAAPNFPPALRRLGALLVRAGQEQEGRQLLEQAVLQQRSPENLISLATVLAYPRLGERGSQTDRERALALAQEASRGYRGRDDSSYLTLAAVIALSLQRIGDFREAVAALVATYPGDISTHYFSAVVAVFDGDWIRADNELRTAERLGLPPEAIDAGLKPRVRTLATIWRVAYGIVYALLAWAVGLIVLFVSGRLLSRATLKSIQQADPNQLTSSSDLRLRKIYRRLVGAAAVYYYVSLPFVALLVIAGAAAVIYGFLLLGQIPLYLVATIAVGALVTLYKMVKSLLIRVESEDPGRALEEAEAPRLWALARHVAENVGTRPIDQIRVTPGTELAVYEGGSARRRTRDEGDRILVLGVGLLNDFRQGAFRAVLAHEYGHFRHRDTAGGDVALRVRQDMMKFALAMAQHGQAVRWNIAFQFLRAYDFLFRRISHGAMRLQEVLADRVAAHTYGPTQFEEGLRHVIRRTVEFEAAADREIQSAIQMQRTTQNLYHLPSPAEAELNERCEEILASPTTADDTHPGPLERFRLLRGVASAQQDPDPAMVWDLFERPDALTAEMTATIDVRVKEAALVGVP
jgi:Zn-dependent protease with chaperone function